MLAGRALRASRTAICKHYTTAHGLTAVPLLPTNDLDIFRTQAFNPGTPAILPRQTFANLPAIRKWFLPPSGPSTRPYLNRSYLSRFGSTPVPLEITHEGGFARIDSSLSFFLECVYAFNSTSFDRRPARYFSAYAPGARPVKRTRQTNDFFSSAASLTAPTARVYLAQASIADLPQGLREDVLTPELVLKAGRGDVYASSIWMGEAPTYTPLHRDPNPNLFVQLAGRKVVRLFRPEVGKAIFARVQEKIGAVASATMRGEEMMQGPEKEALEKEVWGDEDSHEAWQAQLDAGDALFIPTGWWHSIKGIGEGMTGSVNWWFR